MATIRARRSLSSSSRPTSSSSPGNRSRKPAGLMAIASGSVRSSSVPSRNRSGTPTSDTSSTPIMMALSSVPRRVRTCVLALKNGTAHATPSTPLTRCSTVSRRGYGTSIVFTAGSITQMSASGASSITLAARESSPKKIETCWQSRSVLKATPKTRPKHLVASPNSIRNATTNMPISWKVDRRSYSQRSPAGGTSILVVRFAVRGAFFMR